MIDLLEKTLTQQSKIDKKSAKKCVLKGKLTKSTIFFFAKYFFMILVHSTLNNHEICPIRVAGYYVFHH